MKKPFVSPLNRIIGSTNRRQASTIELFTEIYQCLVAFAGWLFGLQIKRQGGCGYGSVAGMCSLAVCQLINGYPDGCMLMLVQDSAHSLYRPAYVDKHQ